MSGMHDLVTASADPFGEAPDFVPRFASPADLPPPFLDTNDVRRHLDIEYGVVNGFRPLRFDLTVPATRTPLPVVVFIHGGAFLGGSKRTHPLRPPIESAVLAAGMAFVSVEYRLAGEAPFPALVHDVKAAIRWLRRFGGTLGVDADRIRVWGESAGGYLAAFLAVGTTEPWLEGTVGVREEPSSVAAAVAWYPPTELLTMDEQAPPSAVLPHSTPDAPESRLLGGPILDHRELAILASPITHANSSAAPLLLMHGTDDRVVPSQQSVVMHEALVRVGADAKLELIPGADHGFEGVDVAPLIERSIAFLDR